MTNPDNNKRTETLHPEEVKDLPAGVDLSLYFEEELKKPETVKKAAGREYVTLTYNPMHYIQTILLKDSFGIRGDNLKRNCADENGKIDPARFLATLKDTHRRIVNHLNQDNFQQFYWQYPQYSKEKIAAEYAEVFGRFGDIYGVGEAFRQYVSDQSAPAKPAEKRITQSWEIDSAERPTAALPVQVRVTPQDSPESPPAPGKRETLRLGLQQNPPMVERKPTLQLVSQEGNGPVAAYESASIATEVTSRVRKPSIPLPSVIEAIRRHPTLQGLPAPSLAQLDKRLESTPPSARRPTGGKLSPGGLPETEPYIPDESPSRPSLHSVNPPPCPSYPPAAIGKKAGLNGLEFERMVEAADAEFKEKFIREYRTLALSNKVRDNLDQRFLGQAVKSVIAAATEIDGSAPEAPMKNFRAYYCAENIDPESRLVLLNDIAQQVAMKDLPELKSVSYNHLKSEFISAFQDRYPIKEGKPRKKDLFNPLFEEVVKEMNRRMKQDREKFKGYCLYYPSGHMEEVKRRAMDIAEENAMNQLMNLEVPVERYLEMIRDKFEKEVVSAGKEDLENLERQLNWVILSWLYRQLRHDNGPRIWLNYFFKGQKSPDKLQRKDADDKLEIIAGQVLGQVKEYCEWLRSGQALSNGNASTPPADAERVDIGEIIGDTGAAAALADTPEAKQNVPLFEGIDAKEDPLKSVIISPEIDPGLVKEAVVERAARPKIADLGDMEFAELDEYGEFKKGDWTIYKAETGYAFAHIDGTMHYENRPYSGRKPEDEKLARQLADLATVGDEDEEDTPPYMEQQDAGDPNVIKLEVSPADRKAQEFAKLIAIFARNTELPVSRGPMGSMPPEAMSAEEAQVEAMKTGAAGPAPKAVEAPVAPVTPVRKSWFRRTVGKAAAVAAIAAGALGIYSAVKSTTDTTEAPQAASTIDTNKGPKVADSVTTVLDSTKTAPTADSAPDTASPDKAAVAALAITPEMIASVKSPALKKVLESGEFTVKANGGGYGQQIRAFFDAEINGKVIAGEITAAEAVQMTKQIEELQNRINTGAALSYYAKYKDLTYGQVYHKRANPGKDSLFAYLERYLGPWESWRAKFEPLTKLPNAQELRENFEKNYEGDMLSFGYDKHAQGNIHWGAHGGDIAKIRDGERELVFASELAKIVLTPKKSVEIDLDWDDAQNAGAGASNPVSKDMNMDNVAPTVEPADAGVDNGQIPDSGSGESEGLSKPPKTGMLNRNERYDDEPQIEINGYTESTEDGEIEVAWSDPEDPEVEVTGYTESVDDAEIEVSWSDLDEDPERPAIKATSSTLSKEMEAELAELEDGWFTEAPAKEPSLEERIAAIKPDRKQALLERGEVFVPSLSEDLNGSVKLAFENGFMKMCSNGIQQAKVEMLARNIRFSEMAEYTATDKGTYAKLSPEKLAQLRAALNLDTPAVTVKSATYNEAMEAELAEIEAGWDTPMDVQDSVRERLAKTADGVIKRAA